MLWEEIEHAFNRSIKFSLSKKKFFFTFPILVLCGFFAIVCNIFSRKAGAWTCLSLSFLSIFLSAHLLLIAGIVLIRLYHHEVKKLPVNVLKTFLISKPLFLAMAQLSIPLIFAYMILWVLLGAFYLFKSIPSIGIILGALFSFGPFILVLSSVVLSLMNLVILFFATPQVALKSELGLQGVESAFKNIVLNPFLNFSLSLIGIIPLLVTGAVLLLAAKVTSAIYIDAQIALSINLSWFFIMIPFAVLLTPILVFFFNFSAESFMLINRKIKQSYS